MLVEATADSLLTECSPGPMMLGIRVSSTALEIESGTTHMTFLLCYSATFSSSPFALITDLYLGTQVGTKLPWGWFLAWAMPRSGNLSQEPVLRLLRSSQALLAFCLPNALCDSFFSIASVWRVSILLQRSTQEKLLSSAMLPSHQPSQLPTLTEKVQEGICEILCCLFWVQWNLIYTC